MSTNVVFYFTVVLLYWIGESILSIIAVFEKNIILHCLKLKNYENENYTFVYCNSIDVLLATNNFIV